MHKRPLAVIAIFFIIGIILARFLPDSVRFSHVFVVTLILIAISFILSRNISGSSNCERSKAISEEEIASVVPSGLPRNDNIGSIFLFLSVISFAALLYINSDIFPNNHISHILGEGKFTTSIVGVIKGPVLARRPYYGKIGSTYLFEIEGLKDSDEWPGVKGLAQVRIQTEKDYEYGDRLLVKGTIRRPASPVVARNERSERRSNLKKEEIASPPAADRNDRGKSTRNDIKNNDKSGFNYREYLERQNIFALIGTKESNVTVLARDYKSNPILKYIYLLRGKIKNQVIEKMPLKSGAFLRAILLGDRSELPKDIQESFRKSGTMHILAISGLHIGLIAVVILYFLRLLRVKREISYCLTIVLLIVFALFTLSRPSVVRAVIMASVFLFAMLLGRKIDTYNSLGAAAIFILVKNPSDLFDTGFQLSFLAVLSILFLAPRFLSLAGKGANFYIKRFIYMPLAVSIAAWLGTFPLIAYYFKIITPVAIIANLLIIPALFVSLIAGLAFLLLGWAPFAGGLLAFANIFCADLIFSLADFFALLKFGHFYV